MSRAERLFIVAGLLDLQQAHACNVSWLRLARRSPDLALACLRRPAEKPRRK